MRELTENIKYIGAEDDNLDLFEGQYPLSEGISYNSYLIDDKEVAIVDAVDIRRVTDWLTSIAAVLGDRTPTYLIVQHMEPDHSGSIREFIARYPQARVVCTAKAAAMLANFFEDVDFSGHLLTVGEDDTLALGRSTLRFIMAPMVHWPEVMMTLDETEGVLFSADAFGTFALSTSTATGQAWDAEARRYYSNIVGRFGQSVQTVMKKLTALKFSTIAPLHGPTLTGDLAHYWRLYDKWSRYVPETEGVLVAYASIYGGTAEAARLIASELQGRPEAGEVVVMDLSRHDVSYAVSEAFRLSRMVLCCSTYDGGLFPPMHAFLHHLESKRISNRRVALVENGSWAPTAARKMAEELAPLKDITITEPVLTIKSRLHHSDRPTLTALIDSLLA